MGTLDKQQDMPACEHDDEDGNFDRPAILAKQGKAFLKSLVTSYFLASSTDDRRLRPYDTAISTRSTCLTSLVFSSLLALSGFGATAALAIALGKDFASLIDIIRAGLVPTDVHGQSAFFAMPLVMAILVTLCNESLGLAHTTSLRWALWREGRLEFNTNLRLVTQARTSKPNHWFVNVFTILVTAATYTAAGQVFIVNQFTLPDRPGDFDVTFSLPALAVVTFGLFSQIAITIWCFRAMRHNNLTWSGNALNNALVCTHEGLERRPNRALISYHNVHNKMSSRFQPQTPQPRQPCLAASRPPAVLVTIALWSGVLVTLIWVSCTMGFGHRTQDVSQAAGVSVIHQGKAVTWTSKRSSSPRLRWTVVLSGIAFTFAIQSAFTFALHCTELLVNTSRDERLWRRASRHLTGRWHSVQRDDDIDTAAKSETQTKRQKKVTGADIDSSAIKDAFTAWETIVLFICKTIIHWAFNEAVQTNYTSDGSADLVIWANCLFMLLGSCLVLRFSGPIYASEGLKGLNQWHMGICRRWLI